MPQGITGAPATFQRLMKRAVGDLHLLQCLVYPDDLIVFGPSLEEHEDLLKVLDRLEECGLTLSIDSHELNMWDTLHLRKALQLNLTNSRQ